MKPIEKRYLGEPVSVDPATRKVVGNVVVYDRRSLDLGGFFEVVKPGAFDAVLRNDHDVVALVNHDDSRVVGRTTAKTLSLTSTGTGLRAEVVLPNTTAGNDLAESISRGDLTGCSFAFRVRPGGERWCRSQGVTVRQLTDLDLIEVSVGVTFPAYPDASAAVRSMKLWEGDTNIYRYRQRLAELEL